MLNTLNMSDAIGIGMSDKLANERELTAWARAQLKELLATDKWNVTTLAARIGVDKGHISKLVNRGEGNIGAKVQRGLLQILGLTPNDMHIKAIEFARKHPEAMVAEEPRVVRDERYENRRVAAEFARRSGINERAIKAVEQEALRSDEDLSPETWLAKMRVKDAELRTAGLPHQKGEKRVPIEDDEPPKEPIRPVKKR